MHNFSVIIPTFNEEFYLEKNIRLLKSLKGNVEIIIADGGSTDKTLEITAAENVKVVKSKLGRGIQLNKGAEAASGDILCFLHADTFLPCSTIEILDSFFENPKNKVCRFLLGFDVEHRLLDKYTYFSKYDTVFSRFGDMFIAVRKNFFFDVNKFPEWKIFEDVEFLKKVSKKEKVSVLNLRVSSSARAFLKYGVVNQQLFNGYLILKYLIGFRKFIDKGSYYKNRKMKNKTSIIIFLRYPKEGKVKTRLASSIGYTKATKIYKTIAEHTVDEIKQIQNCNKYIFYSVEDEKDLIKQWLGKRFFYSHQEGTELGERMKNAFAKVFGHGAENVIIVGTDIPELSSAEITKAIKDLEKFDAVIGPSEDGGYYLLGMKKFNQKLFEDIEYSTDKVFDETIDRITKSGMSYNLLNSLDDIDTEKDLTNWLNKSKNNLLKEKIEKIISK